MVLAGGNYGKMRLAGWALIQYDWYIYKKRRLGRYLPKEEFMKTQQEEGYLQAKKRDHRRNQLCGCLDLGFLVSIGVRK